MLKTWLLVLAMSHDQGGASITVSQLAYDSKPACDMAAMVVLSNPGMFANAQMTGFCIPGPDKK